LLKDNVSLSQISWKAVPVSDQQLQNTCLHSFWHSSTLTVA